MAVQGVKGTGIGQVVIPSAEEALRQREGYVSGIGEAAAPYMQGLIQGEGPMAGRYMPSLGPAEEFRKKVGLPPATTRIEQLGDFVANIPLYGLEGIRRATGVLGDAPAIVGDYLSSPTDAAMADIISKEAAGVEQQLSPFREQARRMGQTVPEMATEQDETQKKIDDLSSSVDESKQQAEQAQQAGAAPGTDEAMANQQAQVDAAGTQPPAQEGDDITRDVENPFETILKQAMDNVATIRGEELPKDLEQYKKEFADATGVNISGKVDKSQALMALGLSLMQNKAGRGFNVSKALAAVGEAGEKAAPLFAKAKSEAKAAKLAAGKYALGQLSAAEQAKASRLAAAQKTVDDLLGKQQDFFAKLRLQQDQQIADTLLKQLEHKNALAEAAAEGQDLYTDKIASTPLFQDAPDVFKMESYIASGNAKGRVPVKLTEQSIAGLKSNLPALEQSLNKSAAELAELKRIVQEEGITVQQQLGSTVNSIVRGFGINVEGDLDPVAKAKIILRRIATQKTPEILGEAGKTISDQDRKRVEEIVGDINMLNGADAQTVLTKLSSVYDLVVQRGRKNLDTAYGTLTAAGYGGADYGLVPEGYRRAVEAADQAADDLSDDEFDELNARLQRLGLPPRTR